MGRKIPKEDKIYYYIYASLTNVLILAGFLGFKFYDIFFFPILIIINTYLTAIAFSFRKKKIKADDSIWGFSNKESDFYFDFETKDGKLTFHKPNHNFLFEARPGMGKSNILKQIITQCAERQYPLCLYDFKGDASRQGQPELSNIAFTAWADAKRKYGDDYKINFGLINFTDLSKSVRVNILNSDYIESELDISNIATTLMKSLGGKDAKQDFWQKYGTQLVEGCMLYLYRNCKTLGFNTLPHAIALLNSDYNALFNMFSKDPHISRKMASLVSAWKAGAESQISGALASGQVPFAQLLNEEIFWVLSADTFSLDVNNPDNPLFLCVANAPRKKQAITPVVAAIFETIMLQMNNAGKLPSALMLDEIPTLRLTTIDDFLATARGNMVSTLLALQSFSQFIRDYSKDSAQTLSDTCGNILIGGCGMETAERWSKFLGNIKTESISITNNYASPGSDSESLKDDKVLQARDIAGQNIGEITGIVADGEPPFFKTQFSEFKMDVREIPSFSLPTIIKQGNLDEKETFKKNKNILDTQVSLNYKKIMNDIDSLLLPFIKSKSSQENE
jgi:hypothetical protein